LDVLIRSTTKEDIPQIAAIHKQQFSTHFLGCYSKSLIEKFYRCFLHEKIIFLVCEQEGAIIGFVLGGLSNHLAYAKKIFLEKYKQEYIIETILNPFVWFMAASRIKQFFLVPFLRRYNINIMEESFEEAITLLSLAVTEEAKGEGVANLLVDAFESKLQDISYRTYGLFVRKKNNRAINFYFRTGFTLKKEVENGLYLTKDIVGEEKGRDPKKIQVVLRT
jgi:ribosomal protein S18 acetylase RimI-like enzyme